MVLYLLKSGVCLALFYGFYKLLLEKESVHTFKRFYLLAALVVAFGIPFITFTEYVEPVPMAPVQEFNFQPLETPVIEETPKTNYLPMVLWTLYGAGVLFFGFLFFKNLWGLVGKIKRNPKLKSKSFINVLLNDLVIPHTFFSYIFLNKHKFETQQIPKEVLLHEETHAKQKHSLDILLIELLQVIFWFNPFIYLFKHSIKLNHEFLADRAVLKQGTASSTYQNMLLAFSSNASEPQLANAINYSSIKKRFTVMKTHTTKKALWFRSLILLPLLAVLIYSFSERKVVEKPQVYQTTPSNGEGVTDALINEYKTFINTVEETKSISFPKYQRAVAIYDLMTEEQRNSVKKYPENPMQNLAEVRPKSPTETEFNSWKDATKFAIWIDGKHVGNSELNNFSVSDIKYFTSSFVHNNARSDRFPQPYQNNLYTEKGFETISANSKKDNSALEQIKKELQKDKATNEIKIHITKDKKVIIDNETIDFNSLSEKLIDLTENLITKPILYLDIEGYVDSKYLKEITDELKESNLNISILKATSIYFDESDKVYNEVNDYFKKLQYTADTIVLKNKNGSLIKGFSGPENSLQSATPKKILLSPGVISVKTNQTENSDFLINEKGEITIQQYKTLDSEIRKSEYYRIIAYLDNDNFVLLPNGWTSVENLKENFNSFHSIKKSDSTQIELLINKESTQEGVNKVREYLENFGSLKIKVVEKMNWRTPFKKPKASTTNSFPQQKATQDLVEEYKKKYNELEVLKKTPPHYVYKTETEQEKMNALFSDLGCMYFRMTRANKQLVARPEAPIIPYVKLTKNGKVEYKKRSELTEEDKKLLPPPPPPPPVPASLQNPSKELLKAKKEFDEKAAAYGKAMQDFNKGKGDIDNLNKQSEEVIKLYKDYMELFAKENASTPPPPVKK